MKFKKLIFIALSGLILSGCNLAYSKPYNPGLVMVTSVSTDGDYAITTGLQKGCILWDLNNHTYKIISKDANIYSAYFIKHSDDFMYQNDKTNEVIIENVNGKIIKQFNPGFPTYGEVISTDLNHYYATDADWNLYSINNGKKQKILLSKWSSFMGAGKLLNMSLSSNNKYLFTAGYCPANYANIPVTQSKGRLDLSCLVLWNIQTGQPIKKILAGNVSKTTGVISPDGRYILTGDERPTQFVASTANNHIMRVAYLGLNGGLPAKKNKYGLVVKFNTSGAIPQPKNFYGSERGEQGIVALQFIDGSKYYLRFTQNTYYSKPYTNMNSTPYAVLFKTTSPWPIKYLPLGTNPRQSVSQYVRGAAIATSPQAHVLVMGQFNGNGIVVYHYNPSSQTLTKVWAPTIPMKRKG